MTLKICVKNYLFKSLISRAFVLNAIVISVLFFIFISISNYFLFLLSQRNNEKVLKEIATKIMGEGLSIAGMGDDNAYDDRKLQEFLIKSIKKTPDIIVMGSSRSMYLHHSLFPENKIFFNHFLASAELKDIIALLGLYKTIRKELPKTIIWGLDPWVFNKKEYSRKWESISWYYAQGLKEVTGQEFEEKVECKAFLQKYYYLARRLITVQETWNLWTRLGRATINHCPIVGQDINDFIRNKDGSLLLPYKFRSPSIEVTKNIIKRELIAIKQNPHKRESFSEMGNIKLFRKIILFLQKENVRLVFFLPSFHPQVYEYYINSPHHCMKKIEKFINNCSTHYAIPIVGSYNPSKYNFVGSDFTDGCHMKSTVFFEEAAKLPYSFKAILN